MHALPDRRMVLVLVAAAGAAACRQDPGRGGGAATQGAPFHLEEYLTEATVGAGGPPAVSRAPRAWKFDEPRPEWRAVATDTLPHLASLTLARQPDAVRLSIGRPRRQQGPLMIAGIAVDLDGGPLGDWDAVHVRARTRERLAGITVAYNLDEEKALPHDDKFFAVTDEAPPVFSDGSAQVYSIPLRPRKDAPAGATLRSLAVMAGAPAAASLEILSVTLVPRGSSFPDAHGVRAVTRGGVTRRALYGHAPVTVTYRRPLPPGARLDFALSILAGDPVTYAVTVRSGGEPQRLFEETVDDALAWRQRSVDLSRFGGRTVDLSLEAKSARPGAVALWAAPVVSGSGRPARPNVIFYVIDGAGADLMSLYGYNRRTTPFLERLAEEGAVFERAFSNSTWTQSSTASFMTSLHHSVLGGLRRGVHSTPVPLKAVTMAEHLHRAGYVTAVFTSNPNAARVIGLERGVDLLDDSDTEHHSTSSAELHERYWRFRAAYPGGPYWVHFQTTDVHEPNEPVAPFAGLFVTRAERVQQREWDQKLFTVAGPLFGATSIAELYDVGLSRSGVDRRAYFGIRRGLYDETMAFQDHELGRFVERLKAAGEWDNTLLVVAADHGHPAGTFARFGRGEFDPAPEPWQGALFDSYNTRVPLLLVFPGRIKGGQRFTEPVSMIDVLPTVLTLAGLPPPEVSQGQSLAPLLLGGAMKLRPVILDEFRVDEATGRLVGNIEVVDGRWGASLEVGPGPRGAADPARGRHAVPAGGRWGAVHPFYAEAPRLLLYDLWADPFARRAVNAAEPERVERYRQMLVRQFEAHQALSRRFQEAEASALTPEQLEQLRALGYVQ